MSSHLTVWELSISKSTDDWKSPLTRQVWPIWLYLLFFWGMLKKSSELLRSFLEMKGLDASEIIMPSFLITIAILQGFKRGCVFYNLHVFEKHFSKYFTLNHWWKWGQKQKLVKIHLLINIKKYSAVLSSFTQQFTANILSIMVYIYLQVK